MIKKDHKLKLAGIVRESIVDGPGIRFTIFAQGCPHNCKGCHNPETHDFAGGRLYSIERLEQAVNIFGSFDENIRLLEKEFATNNISCSFSFQNLQQIGQNGN